MKNGAKILALALLCVMALSSNRSLAEDTIDPALKQDLMQWIGIFYESKKNGEMGNTFEQMFTVGAENMNAVMPCLNVDGSDWYTTWYLDKRKAVRQENLSLANACFNKIPAQSEKELNYESKSLCTSFLGHKVYQNSGVHYKIKRQDDGIHLSVKVLFDIASGDEARAKELLGKMRECIPVAQNVWSRYGIKLDLEMFSKSDLSQNGNSFNQVKLIDGIGRSDSGNYYFQGQNKIAADHCERSCDIPGPGEAISNCKKVCGDDLRQAKLCSVVLHETGHLMGLEDEYEEKKCDLRPFISQDKSPWSMMDDHYRGNDFREFYPRHIKSILAPLCEPGSAADLSVVKVSE